MSLEHQRPYKKPTIIKELSSGWRNYKDDIFKSEQSLRLLGWLLLNHVAYGGHRIYHKYQDLKIKFNQKLDKVIENGERRNEALRQQIRR